LKDEEIEGIETALREWEDGIRGQALFKDYSPLLASRRTSWMQSDAEVGGLISVCFL
jgi:hypothetical protein